MISLKKVLSVELCNSELIEIPSLPEVIYVGKRYSEHFIDYIKMIQIQYNLEIKEVKFLLEQIGQSPH